MPEVSTKPYFIRAIYEWCSDCGFTPYLSVRVDERTRVPVEYVKNGEIVLNVSLNATRNLTINNELVQFSARFNGVSREVTHPGGPGAGHLRPRERPGRLLHGRDAGAPSAAPAGPRRRPAPIPSRPSRPPPERPS